MSITDEALCNLEVTPPVEDSEGVHDAIIHQLMYNCKYCSKLHVRDHKTTCKPLTP